MLDDDSECSTSTILTLSGGIPIGGVYSGPGVSGGNFNASSLSPGVYTITYEFTNAGGCLSSATDEIFVLAPGTVTLNLPDSDECVTSNTLALSGGSPSGGVFSGPGVTGNNFDASVAGVGVHTISYTVVGANGCDGVATSTIVVHDLPIVDFVLTNDVACIQNGTF